MAARVPAVLRSLARRGVGARFYATEAPTPASQGKLQLSLTLPHQAILTKTEVQQVNISTTDGDMGILANHVPTIAQLQPGIIEVFTTEQGAKPKKYFASAGFAVMNPDSTLNINAIEAVPLDSIDFDAARRAIEDVNKRINNTSASEKDKALAKIELEVYEAIVASAGKV